MNDAAANSMAEPGPWQGIDLPAPLTALPGIARDAFGKPLVILEPECLYAFGHLIRSTEQLLLEQFSRGLVSGTTHTCIGQELCSMAVVRALDDPDDAVLSNHRNHGHFLTYSGEFFGLVTEVMGRQSGVCGGRGGSQHLAYRNFHSNGVQGGMTGIGVGMALARKRTGSSGIVAVIVGDGTLGQGLLYESMNLAAVWAAPVLFVVENNGIAQTTYTATTTGGTIGARGAAFGLETFHLSDDDPGLFAEAEAIVRRVRAERRPAFLVIDTARMGPHSKGDDLRDESEKRAIEARDPLARLACMLAGDRRTEIERRNSRYLAAVAEAANQAPEAFERSLREHIFSDPRPRQTPAPVVAPGSNVRQAINAALRHLLDQDPRVLLVGEDLHDPYGGAFKVTHGLSSDFPDRVLSTPISEAGVAGASIGLAMQGMRPIMEVMFADFLTLCMDQIYNHAVKFPGVFPGTEVPLVVRTPCGGRRGYGPTHSQSPENIFTAIPGLTVVFPSHRHDVADLLVCATQRWPFPTLFLEHKLLYGEKCEPGPFRELAPSTGDAGAALFPTLVTGSEDPDLTIVAYGGMLPLAEQAAAVLADQEELAVELVVPCLLAPLPRATLLDHLRRRPRIVIVEETHVGYGVSAELMAALHESGHDGHVARIGTPPLPISSARSLERQLIPDVDSIVQEMLEAV